MFQINRNPGIFVTIGLFIVLAVTAAACSALTTSEPITDITWQWISLNETNTATRTVNPRPESFTLVMEKDGTLGIYADCNLVGGTYKLRGSSLTFTLGASTLAYCGDESLDMLFTEMLGKVSGYSVEGGTLLLELEDGAGTMTFQQGID